MNTTDPLWFDGEKPPKHPPLERDLKCDVCVIGAGFSGLTTAYLLAREGKSVAVIDSHGVAGGDSGLTTAHLTGVLDRGFKDLESTHGLESARTAVASHLRAIAEIEAICEVEGIDCDFERLDGYLMGATDEDEAVLKEEQEAAARCGFPGLTRKGKVLRFPDQAQLHPLRYLIGLAAAVEKHGGTIFGGTRVVDVQDGKPCVVTLENGKKVRAGSVMVATHVPINDRVSMHTKQYAYRTYAIGMTVPRHTVERALYWDTSDPYHYVRLAPVAGTTHDILIVGGEDHKTGQAGDEEERFGRLAAWARGRFPEVGNIRYAWSGQVIESQDGLAFIGRNPGDTHVYIASALSGNGTTYGTIAGLTVSALILGRKSPFGDLYDPSRSPLVGAADWLMENVNAAAQYGSYFTPGELSSPDLLPREGGAIIREGLSKIAAYKDANGEIHKMSAVCPHLGGLVCWNPAEKSWDCPVHGSRFSAKGEVLNGPAVSGLEEADEGKKKVSTSRPRRHRPKRPRRP